VLCDHQRWHVRQRRFTELLISTERPGIARAAQGRSDPLGQQGPRVHDSATANVRLPACQDSSRQSVPGYSLAWKKSLSNSSPKRKRAPGVDFFMRFLPGVRCARRWNCPILRTGQDRGTTRPCLVCKWPRHADAMDSRSWQSSAPAWQLYRRETVFCDAPCTAAQNMAVSSCGDGER